jgi:hypothetical protein
MTEGEIIFIGGIFGTIVVVAAMMLGYHLHTNALNRQAYYECLRVAERMMEDDHRPGIRIVSTPSCSLR